MKIVNELTGKEIIFDDNKILQAERELSFIEANHYSVKSIAQDGEFRSGGNLNSRYIVLVGYINALGEEREKIKREITFTCNPLEEIKIVNSLYDICGYATSTPKFQFDNIQDNSGLTKFLIEFFCPNPFWEKSIKESELISTWIGGWKFKFSLPFKFKQKGEPKKNIYNEGDVETPVEIIFKGPALNPKILNFRTGEFIKVDRSLTSDDTLYITTEFGNKKVEIERGGIRHNAFNYIDLDSTFFQLQVGDNMIEYTTGNDLDPQSVEIRYRNRYLGV